MLKMHNPKKISKKWQNIELADWVKSKRKREASLKYYGIISRIHKDIVFPEIYEDKEFLIQRFSEENMNAEESKWIKSQTSYESLLKNTVWKRLNRDFKCVKLKLTT